MRRTTKLSPVLGKMRRITNILVFALLISMGAQVVAMKAAARPLPSADGRSQQEIKGTGITGVVPSLFFEVVASSGKKPNSNGGNLKRDGVYVYVRKSKAEPRPSHDQAGKLYLQSSSKGPYEVSTAPFGAYYRCTSNRVYALVYESETPKSYAQTSWHLLPTLGRAASARIQRALAAMTSDAGAMRGSTDEILSPNVIIPNATSSSVIAGIACPATLTIEWKPLHGTRTVELQITDMDGKPLLSHAVQMSNNDSPSCPSFASCRSQEIRDALIRWREKNPAPDAFLHLEIRATKPTGTHGERVNAPYEEDFFLLPADDERKLIRALHQWDTSTTGAIRFIGRGSEFMAYKLLPEAYDEYRKAERVLPQSQLVQAAVERLSP